jgi:hypothetical protein
MNDSEADAFIDFAQYYMLRLDRENETAACLFFTRLRDRVDQKLWPKDYTPLMLGRRLIPS